MCVYACVYIHMFIYKIYLSKVDVLALAPRPRCSLLNRNNLQNINIRLD